MPRRRIAVIAMLFVALSLNAQISKQALTQPTPQTKQQLTKALHEYREKKDRHGEALTLLQLGVTEAGLGNVSGARSNLGEAVEKMRAQNDALGAWLALNVLVQLELALKRPADAIPHIKKAFTIINDAKVSTGPFSLKTFLAMGALAGMSAQIPDETNAAMFKPMLLQYLLEPMTHDQYGSVLTEIGDLEKAEAELKAAAAGFAFSQGMYDFSIEAHFGDLRFRQQRYGDARTHYMKALNASSKTASMLPMGGDHLIKAGIYDRLERLETITGHPEEAKRWAQKARELMKTSAQSR